MCNIKSSVLRTLWNRSSNFANAGKRVLSDGKDESFASFSTHPASNGEDEEATTQEDKIP